MTTCQGCGAQTWSVDGVDVDNCVCETTLPQPGDEPDDVCDAGHIIPDPGSGMCNICDHPTTPLPSGYAGMYEAEDY